MPGVGEERHEKADPALNLLSFRARRRLPAGGPGARGLRQAARRVEAPALTLFSTAEGSHGVVPRLHLEVSKSAARSNPTTTASKTQACRLPVHE